MGRRPLPAEEKPLRFYVLFSPDLKARFDALAKERGTDASKLLRALAERELEESERGHAETVAGIGAIEALERAGFEVRKRESIDAT